LDANANQEEAANLANKIARGCTKHHKGDLAKQSESQMANGLHSPSEKKKKFFPSRIGGGKGPRGDHQLQ